RSSDLTPRPPYSSQTPRSPRQVASSSRTSSSSRQPSGRLDLGSSTQLAALGDMQYETGSTASSTERRLSAVILTGAVHPRVHPANVSLLCRVKNRTSQVWRAAL